MPEELEPFYTDGDFTVEVPVSLPVYSSPIRATSLQYVFTQDFMVQRSSYTNPPPLNSFYTYGTQFVTDIAKFYLVAEGPHQDAGGGLVRFTRTYAKIPDPHDEFETYSYPYIGFFGSLSNGVVTGQGRPRNSQIVTSRVGHEYFLVGLNSPTNLGNVGEINIVPAQRYFFTDDLFGETDTDFIRDALNSLSASTPSRTEYNGWITTAAAAGFGSPPTSSDANDPASSGQLVAEDSRLNRWMGNIWLRQTRFVLAR